MRQPLEQPITLSRCSQCGYEASSTFLVGGKCEPCRGWKDTYGPQTACYDTKDKASRNIPRPPKIERTITVKTAILRAQAVYGHIPRFIVRLIRQHTKRSQGNEMIPVCRLPWKLQNPKARPLLRPSESRQRFSSRTQVE